MITWITWLGGVIGGTLVAIGLNMIASEVFSYGTRIGLWCVKQSVRLLPRDQQDRYREEWETHVLELAHGEHPAITGGNHHLTAMVWGFGTIRPALMRSGFLPRWLHSNQAEQHLTGLVFGLVNGLGVGLAGGLVVGLVFGLVFGLVGGLVFGLVGGLVVGLVGGLVGGLVVGLVFGLVGGLVFGLFGGLVFGLVFGLVVGVGPWVSEWCGRWLVGRLRRRW